VLTPPPSAVAKGKARAREPSSELSAAEEVERAEDDEDAEEPPLRVLFGSGPTTAVPQLYARRLATWKRWEDVSHQAQGG